MSGRFRRCRLLVSEFFTDDAIYRIIPRENFEHGLPIATLHCESKGYLQDRVVAIRQTSEKPCHAPLASLVEPKRK